MSKCSGCQSGCCESCDNCQDISQDKAEFMFIAENWGWDETHSQKLSEYVQNNEITYVGHFAKEQENAHKNGYLHASEQTKENIQEWLKRIE